MRAAILLLFSLAAATVGLVGVPSEFEALFQAAFFLLLVVFVVLMVQHLVRNR
jgi:hypothetical protein